MLILEEDSHVHRLLMMEMRVYCPECRREQDHAVLAESRQTRVQCRVCGSVHQITPAKEQPPLLVKTIVSEEDTSRICNIELFAQEPCQIGDHHVAICGEEYIGVEITAIERGQQRVRKARAKDITALWSRKIEEVLVRVSIHDGRATVPLILRVSGEEPFVVGEVYRAGNRRFRIAHMKMRDGAALRHEGQKGIARKIKRVYGYPL
jgi:uncharacterized Zn finger protein